jgi:phosphatidate phosphatase APP1
MTSEPDSSDIDGTIAARIQQVDTLLSGWTGSRDEQAILVILREADSAAFNAMLMGVDLDRLFAKVDDHLFAPDSFTELMQLLSARTAEMTLEVRSRVVNALQMGRTRQIEEALVRTIVVATHGEDLTHLKNAIDRSGSHHDLEKLVFSDIDDQTLRVEILSHIASEADAIPRRSWKVLSDIDDTVLARLHDRRFPSKTVYPGVLTFYEELDRGPGDAQDETGDLTFVTARPFIEGQTRQTLIKAGMPPSAILTGSLFSLISHSRMAGRKFEVFGRYRELFPEYDFIFVGDNGQGDPEFGRRMLAASPDRIKAVFIHNVAEDVPSDPDATTWEDGGLILFNTYVGAAEAAYQHGLISREGVHRVAIAAREELAAIAFDDGQREEIEALFARDLKALEGLG